MNTEATPLVTERKLITTSVRSTNGALSPERVRELTDLLEASTLQEKKGHSEGQSLRRVRGRGAGSYLVRL